MPASCLARADFDCGGQCALAPHLSCWGVVDDVRRHFVMIGGEIEGIRIRLELLHAARDIIVEIALVGVQVQLFADDDAEQALVDEDAHAAKNRTTRNSPERRELFCDVTGQARLDPHIELLTLPECFRGAGCEFTSQPFAVNPRSSPTGDSVRQSTRRSRSFRTAQRSALCAAIYRSGASRTNCWRIKSRTGACTAVSNSGACCQS